MAVTQKLVNFDEYFLTSTGDKVIINDLNYYNIEDTQMLNSSLMTVYNTDAISTVPACDCGQFKGRYKLNQRCPSCGTTVSEPFQKVKPFIWLKALSPEYKFINPIFWMMLKTAIHRKIDFLRWLSDPKYNPPMEIPSYIIGLRAAIGGERNYPTLIANIDTLIIYLLNHSSFKEYDKQETLKELLALYQNNKDKIFTNYLPIINKKMFVMEETNMGKFTNLAISEVIDVVMLWIKTVSDGKISNKSASMATVNTLSKLSILYDDYFDKYLLKKPGAIRKHIYGARSPFTFRCVIISIPGPHSYDDVYVPWAVGVTAFRPHLLNKLVNQRGMAYKEASALVFRSVNSHDPLVEELLNELVAEAPDGKGIPIILHRNPALLQGSASVMYIRKFKNDPEDKCLSISVLSVKGCNADFDGDELNCLILLDEYLLNEMTTLRPYHSIPDLSKPYAVSGNLTLLSPANNILSNILSDVTEYPDLDTIIYRLEGV